MVIWHLFLWLVFGFWRQIVGFIATITLVGLVWSHWEEVTFLWMRMCYAFPLIGKARRLSRNMGIGGTASSPWFVSEQTLCHEFKRYLTKRVPDARLYALSKNYLRKVRETGRAPLSVWGWLLISTLVFLESLGFAYVLAGYTLPGSSEALQIPGAIGIAVLISIGLVLFTHVAGHEWHRRDLVKKARAMWLVDDSPDRKHLIDHEQASLERDGDDDSAKSYMKLIARLNTNAEVTPGFAWLNFILIVFVLILALGAFFVRYQTLESNQIQCVLDASPASPNEFFSGALPDPNALPQVLTAPDAKNRQLGAKQECDSFAKASVVTYIVLAVLFVLIQVIGWTLGYRTGFAGVESKAAWSRVRNFGNSQEYENWLTREKQRIYAISQRHLANLQSMIRKRARDRGVNTREELLSRASGERTFARFVKDFRDSTDPEPEAPPAAAAPQSAGA